MDDATAATGVQDFVLEAFDKVLTRRGLDKALIAEIFTLPGENYLADGMPVVDVDGIHSARNALRAILAENLRDKFERIYDKGSSDKKYSFNARDAARRKLRNTCLGYLMELPERRYVELCLAHHLNADNMTDALSSLVALVHRDCDERQQALEYFYEKWKEDTLVVNKWLSVQALSRVPGTLQRVRELIRHDAFDIRNPNNVRALIVQHPACELPQSLPVPAPGEPVEGHAYLQDTPEDPGLNDLLHLEE